MPNIFTVPFNDLVALEEELANNNIAAFIIEPIQGKGVNIPDKGYLSGAAQLCRKYKALFIADEVQTGLGRTGKFLALEHDENVDPDMVILSKALSENGYLIKSSRLWNVLSFILLPLVRAVLPWLPG